MFNLVKPSKHVSSWLIKTSQTLTAIVCENRVGWGHVTSGRKCDDAAFSAASWCCQLWASSVDVSSALSLSLSLSFFSLTHTDTQTYTLERNSCLDRSNTGWPHCSFPMSSVFGGQQGAEHVSSRHPVIGCLTAGVRQHLQTHWRGMIESFASFQRPDRFVLLWYWLNMTELVVN